MKRIDVLFNDLILLRSKAGIATVADQFLKVFPTIDKKITITRLSELALMRPFLGAGRNAPFTGRVSPDAAGLLARAKQLAAEQAVSGLRAYARWVIDPKYRPAIFFEPDMLPLPMGKKRVAVINDLSVLLFPQWHPAHRVNGYRKYFLQSVQTTDQFISISEASKLDFIKFTSIAADRVHVAPLAPRSQFQPQSQAAQDSARKKFSITKDYFVFLSTLEPRKNLPGLLDAWEKTSPGFRKNHELLLVGSMGWKTDALVARLQQPVFAESLRWLGRVEDEDLVPLLAGAQALLYPSLYEGFGLPPLEAMAVGTPVICSDRGALGETVGDAAWKVNPDKPETIREAIEGIGKERARWARAGTTWVKGYSWDTFSKVASQVFRSLMSDMN
jgi:glycosyltransferase involved in cell wall biosynthesis